MTPLPSQEELLLLFEYVPTDGALIWRERVGVRFAGKVAGSVKKCGYRFICTGKTIYPAHRIVWKMLTGREPDGQIDHINRVRLDNRIENLRDVTAAINSRNRTISKNNKSGVTGVSWHKRLRKWYAQVQVAKRCQSLGAFSDMSDAVNAVADFRSRNGFTNNHGEKKP